MQPITQGQAMPTAAFDLDDLLSESMQAVSEREAAKKLLSRVRQGSATPAERAQAAGAELKAEWTAVGECEVWDQTVCSCGGSHAVFSHYMVEYAPRSGGVYASKRYVTTEPEAVPKGLSPKVIMNIREVFACIECSQPPENAELIVWDGTVTPQASFEA